MGEAVLQRRGHGVDDRAVGAAVAGGHHGPAGRQLVVAQLAVQHQLVRSGLRGLSSRVDFVEEQDAAAVGGQERGDIPAGLADFGLADLGLVDAGYTAQIDRIELAQAQVDHLDAELVGHLLDHLRLAHAGRAVQHDGLLGLDQVFEGLGHLGRTHFMDSVRVLTR